MTVENPQSFPVKFIEKEDLLYCRPDFAEKIEKLSRDEMEYIADKMSDALQDAYWIAMGVVLDDYFDNEDVDSSEHP